jgi:hypothetical protein
VPVIRQDPDPEQQPHVYVIVPPVVVSELISIGSIALSAGIYV